MTPEQKTRVADLVRKLATSEEGRGLLSEVLKDFGLSLMRVATVEGFPECKDPDRLANSRIAVILDTETTGLSDKSEVVELAMMKVRFDERGILSIEDRFEALREPKTPMEEEAIKLTGITPEMLEGKSIDEADVRDFLEGVEMIIAHNAAFDRKMCERTFPESGFEKMAWHCSISQIDWKARGRTKTGLENLAIAEGLVYGSHRGMADVIATAYVLNGEGDTTPFQELLENGELGSIHVILKGAPYSEANTQTSKDAGCRWCPLNEKVYGHSKVWHREMAATPENMAVLAEAVRTIYGKEMSLPAYYHTPVSRYSGRMAGPSNPFETAEFKDVKEVMEAQMPYQPSLI